MSSGGNRSIQAKSSPPSEETLQRLLEVQGKELTIRARELDVRQAELNNGAKWAEASLQAQERDRKDERAHRRKITAYRYVASGVLLFACLIFAGFALHLDKDAIVLEALKLVGSAMVGFGGGYFYGKARAGASGATESDSDGDE